MALAIADPASTEIEHLASVDVKFSGAHIGGGIYFSANHNPTPGGSSTAIPERGLELAPNVPDAWLHLGNTLAAAGKMDEAAEAYLKFAGQPPMGLMPLSRLVHMRKTKSDSPELAILQKYIAHVDNLNDELKGTVHYAAGKAFDDLGDYSKAYEHFFAANEITKTLHPFGREQNTEHAERLRQFATPALLNRTEGAGLSDVAPIFICGMPRSGTTLMDQMFSRHPSVQAGGELPATMVAVRKNKRLHDALEEKIPDADITGDDFARLGEDYLGYVQNEGIKSEYLTDKMPSNYLYIGLLANALPRAKFLIMRRHPLDCLWSNYGQHFGQNQPFSSDFENLAAVYTQFDLMAKHWLSVLPDRVREVQYEDVVADAEAKMRDVLDFVGLEWTPDTLDHTSSTRQVNTASVAQVREPIYTRAVARWRNYAPHLSLLASHLQSYLSDEELRACNAPRPQ